MSQVSKLEPGQSVIINAYEITCMRMRSGRYRYLVHLIVSDSMWYQPVVCRSLNQVNQLIGGF